MPDEFTREKPDTGLIGPVFGFWSLILPGRTTPAQQVVYGVSILGSRPLMVVNAFNVALFIVSLTNVTRPSPKRT